MDCLVACWQILDSWMGKPPTSVNQQCSFAFSWPCCGDEGSENLPCGCGGGVFELFASDGLSSEVHVDCHRLASQPSR